MIGQIKRKIFRLLTKLQKQAGLGNKGWTVSERVAILAAIDKNSHGGDRKLQEQNFALDQNEAAKKSGLGNKETARQATKAVTHGVPELVEKMDAGAVIENFKWTIVRMLMKQQKEPA